MAFRRASQNQRFCFTVPLVMLRGSQRIQCFTEELGLGRRVLLNRLLRNACRSASKNTQRAILDSSAKAKFDNARAAEYEPKSKIKFLMAQGQWDAQYLRLWSERLGVVDRLEDAMKLYDELT